MHRQLPPQECERLIERYEPLVRSVAQALIRKLPASAEFDDLMQDGYLALLVALLQAARREAEGEFRSYLTRRIRGAMLDSLRAADPASRRVRREMWRVERAIASLCHQLGRQPLEAEVANYLRLSLTGYQRLLQEARDYSLLSLEDFDEMDGQRDFIDWCADTGSDPLAALQRRALQRRLLTAINELGEREGAVLNAYYVEGCTMAEIASRLGLTLGRISQIHAQGIARLRAAVLDDDHSLLRPRWRQTA